MRRPIFSIIFVVCIFASALAIDARAKAPDVHGNDDRLVKIVADTLAAIQEPSFDGLEFVVIVHENYRYIGPSPAIPCNKKHCAVFFPKFILELFNDDEIKMILLHEFGHVFYGETDFGAVESKIEAQIRADSFALRQAKRCGLDPAAFVKLLQKFNRLGPDKEWDIRITSAQKLIATELTEK